MVSVPMTFVKVGKNEFQVIYDELIDDYFRQMEIESNKADKRKGAK